MPMQPVDATQWVGSAYLPLVGSVPRTPLQQSYCPTLCAALASCLPQVFATFETMSAEWRPKDPINCSPLMQVGGGGGVGGHWVVVALTALLCGRPASHSRLPLWAGRTLPHAADAHPHEIHAGPALSSCRCTGCG